MVWGARTTAEEVGADLASDIKGKVVLITGVSQGSLGSECARIVAKSGAELVILAGRSKDKLEATETFIREETASANLRLLVLDLADFTSVRSAAKEVVAYKEPIDVLINNAAVMALQTHTVLPNTQFEAQFGTNHLGPFLFTNLIKSRLAASTAPRIVNVSSAGHRWSGIRFNDPNFLKSPYDEWLAYGQSKSANMLFSHILIEKWKDIGLTSFRLHPGRVLSTNLANDLGLGTKLKMMANLLGDAAWSLLSLRWPEPLGVKTIPEGTATHIVAAFDQSIKDQNGSYLVDCQVNNNAARLHAKDKDAAAKLWALSEELVGETFP